LESQEVNSSKELAPEQTRTEAPAELLHIDLWLKQVTDGNKKKSLNFFSSLTKAILMSVLQQQIIQKLQNK